MNRKWISKALSDIDEKYIVETMTAPEEAAHHAPERTAKMGKYEDRTKGSKSRKFLALILAACLVFALAATAYAANLWGLRELFRTYYRELPEEAEPYIQQQTATAAAEEGWSAQVTESLCDFSKVLVTVHISGGDKYIVAPTDVMPQDGVGIIGISGDQSLEEYAHSQGKELLMVGANIGDWEALGISAASVRGVNISDSEMNILVEANKTVSDPELEVTCIVTARNEAGEIERLEIPIMLTEVPSSEGVTLKAVDPDAIPGIHVDEVTITETPMGLTVRYPVTVTDEDAFYNIMKQDSDQIVFGEGGTILDPDGTWYTTYTGCQGTVTDTLTIHYYDWNKEFIGDMVFEKT